MKKIQLLIFTILGMLISANAFSYRLLSDNNGDSCSEIKFENGGEVKVVFHVPDGHMSDYGLDRDSYLELIQAMQDVHQSFNRFGGTTAQIVSFEISRDILSPSNVDSDTFDFDDDMPAIHVGLTNDESYSTGAAYAPTDPDKDSNCKYKFAKVIFKSSAITGNPWIYTTPEDSGENFWNAGETREYIDRDNSRMRYFRLVYVHELLHAFGVAHATESFAMMNRGDRPWLNRDKEFQASPLPDDVRALRYLYPESSAHFEIALTNSWFEEIPSDVAVQSHLCAPSLGDSWADKFDTFCGDASNITTDICPGDKLRVRVSAANFSTSAVSVELEMYLSKDEYLDSSDIKSSTIDLITVNKSASLMRGKSFSVPKLGFQGSYNVIINAKATNGYISITNWIPLNGKVNKTFNACISSNRKVIFKNIGLQRSNNLQDITCSMGDDN
ncbi:MAG: hypothetical protein HOJ35_07285 [Bdellovibrionales bacterium]|jgi:hypothetical protein|nr:hypothetical protein [Bdellovibrionales bacterium]